jgi:hypothetical protein
MKQDKFILKIKRGNSANYNYAFNILNFNNLLQLIGVIIIGFLFIYK